MRSNGIKTHLLLGCAIAIALSSAAYAQTMNGQIETVVVTAQKRAQDVQTVPITVDAFSGDTLRQSNINNVNDLQTIAPSLVVYSSTAGASDTTFKIRGVGTTGNNPGLEGAVGTFIDGVYRNRSGLALGDLFDVERIEVIEGPQSTLFGKNTSAGALAIVTHAPDETTSAFLEGQITNRNGYKVDGWFNVPVSDTLALRFDGLWDKRDGFVREQNSGKLINNRNRYFLKGQALWTPTSNISLRIIADFSHADESCCGVISTDTATSSITAFDNALAAQLHNAPVLGDRQRFVTSANSVPYNNFQDDGISAELNWQISPGIKLTNITAYRAFMQSDGGDVDDTGADIISVFSGFKDHVFSEELRLSGHESFDSGIRALDWLAGVYYTNEQIRVHARYVDGTQAGNAFCGLFLSAALPPALVDALCLPGNAASGTLPIVPAPGLGILDFNLFQSGKGDRESFFTDGDSASVFAQTTAAITDKLSLTGGLRYSYDKKSAGASFVNNNPTQSAPPGFYTFPFWIGDVFSYNQSRSNNALSGSANVQYFWDDQLMTYLGYSRGFKAGGFNLDRTAAGIVAYGLQNPYFKPEYSDSFEAGIKSKWLDDTLLLNGTLFYENLRDLQVLNFDGINFHIYNEPTGTSKGFELQAELAPVDNLLLSGSVTYADTNYGAGAQLPTTSIFGVPGPPHSLVGDPFTNAPLWSTTEGFTYTMNLADTGWTAAVHGDVFFSSARNTASAQVPETRQTSYALLGGRLTLSPNDRWEIAVFCQNCTNTKYSTVVFNAVAPSGAYASFVGDLAIYGINVGVRF